MRRVPLFGAPPEPEKSLQNRIFEYILQVQQSAIQLKMNHWQTESLSEHKTLDKIFEGLHEFADELAESTMGEFGRPKITTTHLTISDRTITSAKWTLDNLKESTQDLIEELRVSGHEGLLALLGDFDAQLKKYLYLITLR